jgi:hypothetical protein
MPHSAGRIGPDAPVAVTAEKIYDSTTGECEPMTIQNYVPPQTTLKAAFYFPWFTSSGDCTADPNSNWCKCFLGPKPGAPKPTSGYYRSDEATVVATQVDQMGDNEIGVVAVEWNGHTYEDANLRMHVAPAVATRGLKWVLLYDMAIALGQDDATLVPFYQPDVRQQFKDHFQVFATTDGQYFDHSAYLKINNRPVVYLYVSRAIDGGSGNAGAANIRDTINAIRQSAQDAGFADLYIVADYLYWGGTDYDHLSLIRPDAITAFAPVEPGENVSQVDADKPVKIWADKMADLYERFRRNPEVFNVGLVDISPGIFAQYDDNSIGDPACGARPVTQKYHLTSATDLSYMVTKAGLPHRHIAQSYQVRGDCSETPPTTNAGLTSILWIYSFNEWGEGAGIEPLESRTPPYPFGFGSAAIETVASAASSSNPPGTPVPRGPQGDTATLRPTFFWDGVPSALDYRLKVFDAGGQAVIDVTVSGTSFRPSQPLVQGADYSWIVRAQSSLGNSQYTVGTDFRPQLPVTEPPATPVPIAPSGCIGTTRPTFTWNAAARATDYQVAIWKALQPAEPDKLERYAVVRGTSFTWDKPESLVPGQQYRWWVKARNGIGESGLSTILYFTPLCASLPTVSIGDSLVTEANSGALSTTFAVTLSKSSGQTVSVSYSTGSCTATAGSDFTSASNLVTFAPGETSQTVAVTILSDLTPEAHETFAVTLSSPTGATILDGLGQGTILDEDTASPPRPRADFNGDGSADLLWRNQTNGMNAVWLMRAGTAIATPLLSTMTDTGWQIVGTADFNGDEQTDILWRQPLTGYNAVWLMNGTSVVNTPLLTSLNDSNWRIVGTGDFNGDSKADIVWRNQATGVNAIWLMDGTTLLGTPTITSLSDVNWEIVGTGDFNLDGHTDLLWRNRTTGADSVWLMNGTNLVGTPSIPAVSDVAWKIVGTDDFNRDGKVDIVWQHSDGHLVVWFMDGLTRLCYPWLTPDQLADASWKIVGPR